jgi:hypothetical protein
MPLPAAAVLPIIGAGTGLLTGTLPNLIEANRLRKERKRLLAQGAPGLSEVEKKQIERAEKMAQQPLSPEEQQQYAAAQARAASRLAPGYAQEIEGIAQQQADVLAAGKRGSATSSNLLNLLSRMNLQGQAARRSLAMRGEQAQRAAQGDLGRLTSYAGQAKRSAEQNLQNLSMLADARREQRRQLWEAQLAAMDRARREMIVKAWSAPIQGGLSMTTPEAANSLAGLGGTKPAATGAPYTPFSSYPQQFAPSNTMYNPYSGQQGMMMTNYGGPGATPPTYQMYEEPDYESYYTPFKK